MEDRGGLGIYSKASNKFLKILGKRNLVAYTGVMETFAKQLSELADYALTISGIKNPYSDEDMINATLVFMEVFSSRMFDQHSGKLTEDQMTELFQEAGNSMHQTIKLFTGIDTKAFFNN